MLRLIGLVLSIGLADSLNPSSVGPALYLAGGERPRDSVIRFGLPIFVIFFLAGVVLTLGPGHAILALVPRPTPTARYILETVAGVAMLLAAPMLWRRRERLSKREASESHPKRHSPALMGATIAVVELPTAFPYFAAIAAVVGSGLGIGSQLILVLIYNLCFVLPLIAIVVTITVAGEDAVVQLVRARNYMHEHWPALAAFVALLAGAFVMLLGITGLTGMTHGRVGRLSRRVRHLISH